MLNNLNRDLVEMDWLRLPGLGTSDTDYGDAPSVRSDGTVAEGAANASLRVGSTSINAGKCRSTGLYMVSKQSGIRATFRIQAHAFCSDPNVICSLHVGAGPASPSASVFGQSIAEDIVLGTGSPLSINTGLSVGDFSINPGRVFCVALSFYAPTASNNSAFAGFISVLDLAVPVRRFSSAVS